MTDALRAILLVVALLPGTYAIAHKAGTTSGNDTQNKSQSDRQLSSASADGEKRFHEHCGRCHNSPEDLSPREAKAVIRKMRVRAVLSTEDEKLILQYIAP